MSLNLWPLFVLLYILVFIWLLLVSLFGHHLGLSDTYIKFLSRLFKFSQQSVEKHKRWSQMPSLSKDSDDCSYVEGESLIISLDDPKVPLLEDPRGFHLDHIIGYITVGIASVVQDSVLPHFVPEELPGWNLLSRNNKASYEFVSFRLTVLWAIGFMVRYFLLLPVRLLVLFIGMVALLISSIIVSLFSEGRLKRKLNASLSQLCFRFVACSISLVATFHDDHNLPKNGIAVANHTSPIDSLVLATDNCYDMIGQKHGGLLGYFMSVMSRSSAHIWFRRSEYRDRNSVIKRLQDHTKNTDLPPILIFPEGVCVNNTSIMQFKKGAFEVDCSIYPIAIRFDPRFGDAFWAADNFFPYVVKMMTSWAIVCDVWYLPPLKKEPSETAISFAARVKSLIASRAGLQEISWDGFLKAKPVKCEWKQRQQEEFAKHLIITTPLKEEDEDTQDEEDGEEGTCDRLEECRKISTIHEEEEEEEEEEEDLSRNAEEGESKKNV